MPNKYTFDTSFIIARKLSEIPDNFLLSDVVALELIGAASDESNFKALQRLRNLYRKDGLLIIPDDNDWLMAGKILYWLEQGSRSKNKGKSIPKRPGATQRMALDVLLAVSARRNGVTVVTENWRDFEAIQYYCAFKFIRGSDFSILIKLR